MTWGVPPPWCMDHGNNAGHVAPCAWPSLFCKQAEGLWSKWGQPVEARTACSTGTREVISFSSSILETSYRGAQVS